MITRIKKIEDKHYKVQEIWYLKEAQHILEKMKITTKNIIKINGTTTTEMGIAMKTGTIKSFLEERFANITLTEKNVSLLKTVDLNISEYASKWQTEMSVHMEQDANSAMI